MSKSRDAFRTISEVSELLDTPAHVLRFWESKFTQVKPVKRAGGRRYYRPADVDLLAGIKKLLHDDGMTIKGAQKLMRENGVKHVSALGSAELDAMDTGTAIDAEVTPVEASQPAIKAPPVAEDTPATPDAELQPELDLTPSADDALDAAVAEVAPAPVPKPALKVEITNVVSMASKKPTPPARPAVPNTLSAIPTPPPTAEERAAPEEPTAAEPSAQEPAVVEPASVEPVAEDFVAAEPAPEEPATAEPAAADPVSDEPAPTEPVEEEPESSPEPAEAAETPEPTLAEETTDAEVEPEEPVAAQAAAIQVPDDPSDSDSKLPARLFHILHKAPHDRLAAKAEAIAPLLDRMQVLRDRIGTR